MGTDGSNQASGGNRSNEPKKIIAVKGNGSGNSG